MPYTAHIVDKNTGYLMESKILANDTEPPEGAVLAELPETPIELEGESWWWRWWQDSWVRGAPENTPLEDVKQAQYELLQSAALATFMEIYGQGLPREAGTPEAIVMYSLDKDIESRLGRTSAKLKSLRAFMDSFVAATEALFAATTRDEAESLSWPFNLEEAKAQAARLSGDSSDA